jgi:hypothetical protein
MEWALIILLVNGSSDFTNKTPAAPTVTTERTLGIQPTVIAGFASEKLCEAAAEKIKKVEIINPADPSRRIPIAGPATCVQVK